MATRRASVRGRASGVSVVLATVLLLAITLVSVILIYSYIQEQAPPPVEEPVVEKSLLDARVQTIHASVHRYRAVTITNNVAENLTDYSVVIELNSTNFNDWASITEESIAVLLNTTGGLRPLYYWVSEFNATEQRAVIWVRVPELPSLGSVQVLIVYNESNIYADYNNPRRVFLFFEDAEEGGIGQDWVGAVRHDSDGDGLGRVYHCPGCARQGVMGLNKTDDYDPDGAYKPTTSIINRTETSVLLEFWVYRPSASLSLAGTVDRLGLIDDFGNGYGWGYNHATDSLVFDVRTNYHTSYTLFSAPPDILDEWYRGVFIVFSNGTIVGERYDKDGNLQGRFTVTDSTYGLFSNVYIFGGWYYCVDDIILRKIVDPEPHATVLPDSGNLTLIRLVLYNTGKTPLTIDKVYVYGFDTDSLEAVIDLSKRVSIQSHTNVDAAFPYRGQDYYRIVIATEEGLRIERIVSLGHPD